MVLKVTGIGNSTGVILPKEILERLQVEKGYSLYVLESSRGIELTAYVPAFVRKMSVAESVMQDDADALRELAK